MLWHDVAPPAGQPDEARGNSCVDETSIALACAIPRSESTATVHEESIVDTLQLEGQVPCSSYKYCMHAIV